MTSRKVDSVEIGCSGVAKNMLQLITSDLGHHSVALWLNLPSTLTGSTECPTITPRLSAENTPVKHSQFYISPELDTPL